MMRVLLLGGAGYIGAHVCRSLLDRGWRIGVYDNLSTGLRENIPAEARFFEADIRDSARLSSAMNEGWDGIVHLAALKAAGESMQRPGVYARANICGSLEVMDRAVRAGVRGFVLSSSAAVYGEPEYLPIDEKHPTVPANYYGFTKLSIERNLAWFHRLTGLRHASLRYFNAAGYDPQGRVLGLERNPANLIPVVMETAVGLRERLLIFGDDYPTTDGTGVRDYIHVTDLAEAHAAALEYILQADTSITVNLGSETGMSVLQILEAARRITGRRIPAAVTGRRPGDPAQLVATSALARRLLRWSPRYSGLDTIVQSTWQAYRRAHPERTEER